MHRRASDTLRRLDEYFRRRPAYQRLCDEAATQVRRMLEHRGVPFASISGRVKSWHSMSERLSGKAVPPSQFMTRLKDTAGVRIVVWRPSDRTDIARDIHELFNVHETKEASLRRSADGYSDDKYYCSLRPGPGVGKDVAGLTFELQVQTAMMNAWASAGHDLSYKAPFQLPDILSKRFALLAALMDLADDNMNALTDEVAATAAKLSDDRLNVLGLKAHLDAVVDVVDTGKHLVRMFTDAADARSLVIELRKCGVQRLDDLRHIINRNTVKGCLGAVERNVFLNYSSLVRLILIMKKPDSYFSRVAYDVILLDRAWLKILKALKVDYLATARSLGKPIYVSDEKGMKPLH